MLPLIKLQDRDKIQEKNILQPANYFLCMHDH